MQRTITTIIFLVACILLITSYFFYRSSKANYLEQNNRLLKVMKEQAHHFLLHPEQELRLIETTITRELDDASIQDEVLYVLNHFSYINRVEKIDDDGKIIATFPEKLQLIGLDYSKNPVYTTAISIEPDTCVFGGTFIDPIVGSPVMTITLKSRNNTYLVGYLDLSQLESAFSTLEDADFTYAILDEKGHYLLYPDKDYITQRKVDPSFEDIVNDRVVNGTIVLHDNQRKILQFDEIASTGWYLIIYQNLSKMIDPIIDSIIFLTIAFLLIVIFTSISITSALSRVQKTLLNFIKLTKNVTAGDYESKSIEYDYIEFHELSANFQQMVSEIEIREEEIIHLNNALENSYLETVVLLAKTIEAKDSYTGDHCERVKKYALRIGEKIGLSIEDLIELEQGSLLHDIGKLNIPESVLSKPGSLTDSEYSLIKKHSEFGYELIKDIPNLEHAKEIVLYHHERYDGKGYPKGLKGDEIPLFARIVCIVDAFDAMTSSRVYRPVHYSLEKAIIELKTHRNNQFDGLLVDVFIECLNEDAIEGQ